MKPSTLLLRDEGEVKSIEAYPQAEPATGRRTVAPVHEMTPSMVVTYPSVGWRASRRTSEQNIAVRGQAAEVGSA
jgi:hypothetical protein